MRLKNLMYGLSLIAISVFVFIYGSSFPDFVVRGNKLPGPKFFPFLISILLVIMGSYFVITSLLKLKKTKMENEEKITTKKGLLRVLTIILGIGLYVPFINLVGFKIGTFVFATVIMSIFGVKILKSLLYSLILTVIIVLIFEKIFLIPFPQKFLPF